jgi:lauroyl/myristoyl acyltransferase
MGSNPCVRVGIGAVLVLVRRLERIFPPAALRLVLAPFIAARVAVKSSRPFLALPECLGKRNFQITKRQQRRNYLNTTLEFFPEQLGTAKWRDRLQIFGIEHIETARREKRPVVMAFSHFGPYVLQRYWLRAAGFPAANLVEGHSKNRSVLNWLKDRVSPFPEIPTAFHREDQLREALTFVSAGNLLLVAIDILNGKQMNVPVDEHWQFGMASGAIRIAMRNGAALIPCSIVEVDAWRFQIRLGPPVPASLLASGDPLPIGRHLLDALLPVLREYPEQCTERLVKQFARIDSKNKSYESTAASQLAAR